MNADENNYSPIKVTILGVLIGHAYGWDEDDLFIPTYYDFVPIGSTTKYNGIMINLLKGILRIFDEEGEVMDSTEYTKTFKQLIAAALLKETA